MADGQAHEGGFVLMQTLASCQEIGEAANREYQKDLLAHNPISVPFCYPPD